MSSNKTEHYQLHKWEADDDFLRTEFNENFEKLDGAARAVFGVYTGDGAKQRFMALGFTPKVVLILPQDGKIYNNNYYYGGMAVADNPIMYNTYVSSVIMEGGFQISHNSYGSSTTTVVSTNTNGKVYHYLALM